MLSQATLIKKTDDSGYTRLVIYLFSLFMYFFVYLFSYFIVLKEYKWGWFFSSFFLNTPCFHLPAPLRCSVGCKATVYYLILFKSQEPTKSILTDVCQECLHFAPFLLLDEELKRKIIWAKNAINLKWKTLGKTRSQSILAQFRIIEIRIRLINNIVCNGICIYSSIRLND